MKGKNTKEWLALGAIFLLLVVTVGVGFAQENPTRDNGSSLVTLKTTRALFPNIPVSIANEIHGGLHVVATVLELHGKSGDLVLNDKLLQKGMLVWVQANQMYYIYKGPTTDAAGNQEWNDQTERTDVNSTYWEALSTIFSEETITVISGCTRGYNLNERNGNLDKDGVGTTVSLPLSGTNKAGNHLILMPSSGTTPLAVYVWDDDNNVMNNGTGTGQWTLVYKATKVFGAGETGGWVLNPADNKFYTDNTYTTEVTKVVEGDIAFYNGESHVYDGEKWTKITTKDTDLVDLVRVAQSDLYNAPTITTGYEEGDIIKKTTSDGDYVSYVLRNDNNTLKWEVLATSRNVFDAATTQNWTLSGGQFSNSDNIPIKGAEGDLAIHKGDVYVYDGPSNSATAKWVKFDHNRTEVHTVDEPFDAPSTQPYHAKAGTYHEGDLIKQIERTNPLCFAVWLYADTNEDPNIIELNWVIVTPLERFVGHVMGIRRPNKIDVQNLVIADFTQWTSSNNAGKKEFSHMPYNETVILDLSTGGGTGNNFAFAVPSGWSKPKIFGHLGHDANNDELNYFELSNCWHKSVHVWGHTEYQVYVLDTSIPISFFENNIISFCIE